MTAGCAAALACALAQAPAPAQDQDLEAPPAIAQWGIANWASHMPPQLPAGAVAPGSLIRIRGWRLGGAPGDAVLIRIRRGADSAQAAVLSATDNEIEALLPQNTPVGNAMLQVVKNGHASLEWPVAIVNSSFGAFARNGQGWGVGEVTNAGGAPNSAALPARLGETVRLAGTGLGANPPRKPPQVLVGGRPANKVRPLPKNAARPGVDEIEFELPPDAPEGCHVPVQVGGAPGIYSNAVTLSVSRNAGPCADTGWSAGAGNRAIRLGTIALMHADLLLGLTPKQSAHFPIDAGFASFAAIEPGASANALFLFPPRETCTAYSGSAGLHSITSPLAALEALPGTPLDAGAAVTVAGSAGNRSLPRDHSRGNYWAVIGGQSPVPGARELPLFLSPGDYAVSAGSGSGVNPMQTKVRVRPPLVWLNREQLSEVDRARGATVTWRSSASGIPTVVLIVAMNVDSRSGALGVCACLANAADGSFRIPAYALANIPESPEHPRGFPLNLVLLTELPEQPDAAGAEANAGMNMDRVLAFAASLSGRTVRFR
jgi:uncharacterized protein (TIGR03437 family)